MSPRSVVLRTPATVVFTTLLAAANAQCPPGAAMPTDVALAAAVPKEGQSFSRWQNGKDALTKNDLAAARTHLLAALEFHPASLPMLVDLVLACRDDADQLAMQADRLVRAAIDAKGQVKLESAMKKAIAMVPTADARLEQARALTQLRTAALAELVRCVERNKPSGNKNAGRAILVRHAADALLLAARGMPAQLASFATNVDKTAHAFEPDQEVVVQGLAKVMRTKPPAAPATAPAAAPAPDRDAIADRALRAARILAGLQRQGANPGLRGAAPRKFDAVAEEAQKLLDAHSASLASAKVWTVAELEAMTDDERVRFTEAHANWRTPGISISPKGRYRIETTCGHATLLATAQTIESHHARLVAHFGADPFQQQIGSVRIVPEQSDLETEGVPFWWAPGFQSGDRTAIRFAWSDAAALGRTLTHELTHRFDNVLRAFSPAWYLEGHAEWTCKHYAKIADREFVDDYLHVGAVAHTCYRGYGNPEQFENLLKGSIEDYRDNYPAGYSLYSFLRSWPRKAPRYRDALATWEKNARGGRKDPVGWFTKCFCDGAAGRPTSLDGFFEDWKKFVDGCYDWWQEKRAGNEWVDEYGRLDEGDSAPLIPDAPTWSWARSREEPFFGQDHAALATRLLHEVADAEATIAAGVWSLAVDGWRPDTCRAVAEALAAGKANETTAAFAALVRSRFPSIVTQPITVPPPRPVQLLLDALTARVTALDGEGCNGAASMLAAEHDELGALWGRAPIARSGAGVAAPPRHVGEHGFAESELVDFDRSREKNLWYVASDGDLHVGRERPRDGTGSMDREAQERDAFVHSAEWQRPGAYVVRGRIQFTTSYARGAIVFGNWRRDRGLRITFSTGNERYAAGKTEENHERGLVYLALEGAWERDPQMPDNGARPIVEMKDGVNWFDFALHVNGPRVRVEIDGKTVLHYATHDGSAIEGAIGFATGSGAIRVQQPTVQRVDATTGRCLDLASPTKALLDDLLMLPVQGVAPSRHGTFVLLLPKCDDDSVVERLQRHAPALLGVRSALTEYPQPWLLAVPQGTPEARLQKALEALQAKTVPLMAVVEHRLVAPFDGVSPWVLYVDGASLLRAAAPVNESRWEHRVKLWARRFRGR